MLFPEITIRSSSASNQNIVQERNPSVYLSGTKQNFQRYLVNSSNSNLNSATPKNLYSNSSACNNFDNRSSLHEKNFALAKKNMIRRNERNFPKDFFENVLRNNNINHHKTESTMDSSKTPPFFTRNNSCLMKGRISESIPNQKSDLYFREKTLPDDRSNLISNRYPKFSKIEFFKELQTKSIDNSMKKLPNDADFLKEYLQTNLEDSDLLLKKPLHKSNFNNPKMISKSHPLKPIVIEKSQSTQENSKILTDNENEFLESGDTETTKITDNDNSTTQVQKKKNEQQKTEENKNWGALFTFYNNNLTISKDDNKKNEKEEIGNEEGINRKTGHFKSSQKIVDY